MKWLVLICVVFVACAQQTPPAADGPSTPAAPSTSAPQQPIPDATAAPVADDTPAPQPTGTVVEMPPNQQKEITIENVETGNPLTISGRARTFENNVVLRARDAEGGLITESFTTAQGDMGTHNPYRGSLFLTSYPGRTIVVEALEYSAKDGSERSLVRVQRPFNVERIQAQLYFPDAECAGVNAYTRDMPKSISSARLLLEALVQGPIAPEKLRGAVSMFPAGSRIESVNLRNGTLTVDFNERLRNVGGACRAQMIRASVTETLRRLPNVQKVVITAGGSEQLALQP